MSLAEPLRSGDVVEILRTTTRPGPSPLWLLLPLRSRTKSKIRKYFRSQERRQRQDAGRRLLECAVETEGFTIAYLLSPSNVERAREALGRVTEDELYNDLLVGKLTATSALDALKEAVREATSDRMLRGCESPTCGRTASTIGLYHATDLRGDTGVILCDHCEPLPGDPIVVVPRTDLETTLVVHRQACKVFRDVAEVPSDAIEPVWAPPPDIMFRGTVVCCALRQTAALDEILRCVRELGVTELGVRFDIAAGGPSSMVSHCRLTLEIDSLEALRHVVAALTRMSVVVSAARLEV